jgi:hypothetical protein
VFDLIKDLRRATGPDVCIDVIRYTVQMENNPPLNLHDFGFKAEIEFL